MEPAQPSLRDRMLDAAEAVVARQGIAHLTLEAVAAEAGISKGGLLHHFPTKDKLVEGMVVRSAAQWRSYFAQAYDRTPPGPGRMARALLGHCMANAECWDEQLRHSSSAVFAALAQNPSLIEPMRAAYADLYARVADDGLPPGHGEAVIAAVDGLWLYWVLRLVPVDKERIARVRRALETLMTPAPRARAAAPRKRAAAPRKAPRTAKQPPRTPQPGRRRS
jgi:AcrR family transcriptional regulator